MLLSIYSLLTREELYNLLVDCEISLDSSIINSYDTSIVVSDTIAIEDLINYSNVIQLNIPTDILLICDTNISLSSAIWFDESVPIVDYMSILNAYNVFITIDTETITVPITTVYQNGFILDDSTAPTCTSWLSYNGYVNLDTVVSVVDTLTGGPQNSIAIIDETTPICLSTVNYTGFIIADELATAEINVIAQGLNVVSSIDEFDIEDESNIILIGNADIINTIAVSTQLSIYGYNQIDISESIALIDDIARSNTMYSSIENVISLQPSVNLVYNKDVLVSCIIDIDSTIKAFQYFKVRKWDMKIRDSLNLRKVDREIKLNKVERKETWSLVNRNTSPWIVTVLT